MYKIYVSNQIERINGILDDKLENIIIIKNQTTKWNIKRNNARQIRDTERIINLLKELSDKDILKFTEKNNIVVIDFFKNLELTINKATQILYGYSTGGWIKWKLDENNKPIKSLKKNNLEPKIKNHIKNKELPDKDKKKLNNNLDDKYKIKGQKFLLYINDKRIIKYLNYIKYEKRQSISKEINILILNEIKKLNL